MKHYALLYIVTLVMLIALDVLWIGGIARNFYKNRIGNLLEFHAIPGALFYLLYTIGILVFVHGLAGDDWHMILLYGALFGLMAFGTYDLTNLATLRGWSISLGVVDMVWGCFTTAMASTIGLLATRYAERLLS